MSAPVSPAAALVAQCRDLEQRARRLGLNGSADCAHDWGNALLNSGVVAVGLYRGFIDQLGLYVASKEIARELAA